MAIQKLRLVNFKQFQQLTVDFSNGINILVGRNDAGKSTIMEAIHLAVTGLIGGRPIRNELSQHLFNNDSVATYLQSVKEKHPIALPEILIEVFLTDDPKGLTNKYEGSINSTKNKATGFLLKVHLDEACTDAYEALLQNGTVSSLPIEYYTITCRSFAEEPINPRTQIVRSALIDSSSARYQNGSDAYVSRIVRDSLEMSDGVAIAQAYRHMKDEFRKHQSIEAVNAKLTSAAQISNKPISLAAELPAKSDWEDSLVTCVADVPFQYIGKGEQNLVKTKLALSHKKAATADIILLEEPENHLTHDNLNALLDYVERVREAKQVIVSTHSSFVANKLGLKKLILVHDKKTSPFASLDTPTMDFFQKIAGYDTLRLILATKTILVEGPSDELVVQRAYLDEKGCLPIAEGVDVISVGTSFLRFLKVADLVKKPVVVMTDNDGDPAKVEMKYTEYLPPNKKDHVKICFDRVVDRGNNQLFNYNTLEPKLVKANSLDVLNGIFGTTCKDAEEIETYMVANKTDCALKLFSTDKKLSYPQYILDAIA